MELFYPTSHQPRRIGQLVPSLAWLVVTAIAALLKPDIHGHGTHQQLGLPPCPSVLLFDRPCPGCGLTTSWTALIHGQVAFAFHCHPLGPIAYAIFTAYAAASLYAWVTGRTLATDTPSWSRVTIVGALIFIGFGLVRMAVTPNFGTANEHALVQLSREFHR